MKKYLFIFIMTLFCFAICSYSNAQDIIVKTDSSRIQAKVLEVSESTVVYKKHSNPDGPKYTVSQKQIHKIIYANGTEEIYNAPKGKKQINLNTSDYSRHIISFHLFDIVLSDFTLSYEFLSKDHKLGIVIPVGIGYNTDMEGPWGEKYNRVYSGIGLRLYQGENPKVRYFFGPELRLGYGMGTRWDGDYTDFYYGDVEQELYYWKLYIDNGLSINPSEDFNISFLIGLGVKYIDRDVYDYNPGISSSVWYSIRMGFRI